MFLLAGTDPRLDPDGRRLIPNSNVILVPMQQRHYRRLHVTTACISLIFNLLFATSGGQGGLHSAAPAC
jgi:hypothetical protein